MVYSLSPLKGLACRQFDYILVTSHLSSLLMESRLVEMLLNSLGQAIFSLVIVAKDEKIGSV